MLIDTKLWMQLIFGLLQEWSQNIIGVGATAWRSGVRNQAESEIFGCGAGATSFSMGTYDFYEG